METYALSPIDLIPDKVLAERCEKALAANTKLMSRAAAAVVVFIWMFPAAPGILGFRPVEAFVLRFPRRAGGFLGALITA